MFKKFWLILGGIIVPSIAQAAVDFGTGYGTAIGLGTQDIRTTVARIINVTLGILGMLMVLIIIYGVVGAANGYGSDRFDTSKRIIAAGVIGLIIIVVAYALSTWVFNVIADAT